MKDRIRLRPSSPLALLCAAALLGGAPAASAAPQAPQAKKAQRSTLDTVRSVFQRLDGDRNDLISATEARRAQVTGTLFKSHDADASQGLDRDEFTVLYRELLTRANRAVPADLQAEVAKIQARRRAAEAKRKKAQEDAAKAKTAEADAAKTAAKGTGKPATAGTKPQNAKPAAAPAKTQPAPVKRPATQAPPAAQPAPAGATPTKPRRPAIRKPDATKSAGGNGQANGTPDAGNGQLTPEAQAALNKRINDAREKWMREMREAQAKKDQVEAEKMVKQMESAYGAKLPADLQRELAQRVAMERIDVLLQWVTSNPKEDLTNLSPKSRTELARLIDESRTSAQNAWAAEKRAMLVERARRAKQGAGSGNDKAEADDAKKAKADDGQKARVVKPRRAKPMKSTGAQGAGAKPAGTKPAGNKPAGTKPVGAKPAGATPAGKKAPAPGATKKAPTKPVPKKEDPKKAPATKKKG